jgi:hypothetical protein
MPRTNSRGGGRIRATDGTAATVRAEVQVRAEHVTAVNATKTKECYDETRRGHRRCLKKLMEWWMPECSDYFEAGTHILSAEEKADPMKFFHKCDREIACEGLRIDMVLSSMAATKKKAAQGEGQKIYSSYTHMRKINDAVLFGARTVKQILSSSYYSEMNSYLTSF